ncbi:IspD/TarI family cytidylyltransferase [Spiroplasma taiwanense]|uniref:2-C-methyl-D-erythritol 4-phosphate cytidylyltransferase n=1 Tax=Spiroplasma taiwanense CT-1 TaxID=1276220 RepID=S5LYJ6_9MOLU|nr:IspD/TarI family cytidylyltransferase [Spiroplasma taiwanense]AGR40717.1 2-C-methyl-D-erythritol 4-phosphate cytidylyltransferase [Spiroplasma taiwanense CT-1]
MISLIIVANGSSVRFGENKMLVKLKDEFLILKTIKNFLDFNEIDQIILVSNDQIFNVVNLKEVEKVYGGLTRSESVQKGLEKVRNDFVIIHDGARPFTSKKLIKKLIQNLKPNIAVIPILKITNCLKKISNNKIKTVDREQYFISQTPQGFYTKLIIDCYKNFNRDWFDDSQAIEENNGKLILIEGDKKNIKITFKEDIETNLFFAKKM